MAQAMSSISGKTPSSLACPICEQPMALAGNASYYSTQKKFQTDMWRCKACAIYFRDVDHATQVDHFDAASYVQLKNEEQYRHARQDFFVFILGLAKRYQRAASAAPATLIDFGSAYGHLLEAAGKVGFKAVGIELNKTLVDRCRQEGLTAYQSLADFGGKADVFLFVDSLYCLDAPRQILDEVSTHLGPDGIVIARVTNRNWYVRLRGLLTRKTDLNLLGDMIIGYSVKGVRRLFARSQFEIIKVLPDAGVGKNLGFRKEALYRVLNIVSVLSGGLLMVTPGVIVIAQRVGQRSKS